MQLNGLELCFPSWLQSHRSWCLESSIESLLANHPEQTKFCCMLSLTRGYIVLLAGLGAVFLPTCPPQPLPHLLPRLFLRKHDDPKGSSKCRRGKLEIRASPRLISHGGGIAKEIFIWADDLCIYLTQIRWLHNPPKEHEHYSGFQNSGVKMLTAFSEDHPTKNGGSLDKSTCSGWYTNCSPSLPFSYSLGFGGKWGIPAIYLIRNFLFLSARLLFW